MKRMFSLNQVVSQGEYDRSALLLPGSFVSYQGRTWRVVELDIEKDRIALEN